MTVPWSRSDLIAASMKLGAAGVPGISKKELTLGREADASLHVSAERCVFLREQIRAGEDPLGSAFIGLRTAAMHREVGATYTPEVIVRSMVAWARDEGRPGRVVDPGVGSGRFLLEAARAFPDAELVGVEIDPLAALVARANLFTAGVANRARVELADFRRVGLRYQGQTLYIGNPPYVRHHRISPRWKNWFTDGWRQLGFKASQLSGLHIHFFLAVALNAAPGDYGTFITAAEWLDVNYGTALRNSFLGNLGGTGIVVIEPTAAPFPDAATTAAITRFRIGSRPESISVRRVCSLGELEDPSEGELVARNAFEEAHRWSPLARAPNVRAAWRRRPPHCIELGEICRVHRGQATGLNRVWIEGQVEHDLPPWVLFPTVTRARELIAAGRILASATGLRRVVDLPEDLDELDAEAAAAAEGFLKHARRQGAHRSYLARHRRAWWSVGLRSPAPILATYMARRPPVFTRNLAGARHLNIAHGLYPRNPLTAAQVVALVDYLSTGVSVVDGRTYAGGLTKFEPREMERLLVPRLEMLVPADGALVAPEISSRRQRLTAAAKAPAPPVSVRLTESGRSSPRR